MIFRWSIWGKSISQNRKLLQYSFHSFKKQFGKNHRYIVYTDNPSALKLLDNDGIEIRNFPHENKLPFCIASKATWLKWCPTARLDVTQHEIFVDSDVFLLQYPQEIIQALDDPKVMFVIMDEFEGKSFQHGAMRRKTSPRTPFVNAGLFIQKAGYEITLDLVREFEWWKVNIPKNEHTHHDEQGALAIALTQYFINGQVFILPKSKYMIISESSNRDIKSIDEVTLFHATYQTHPAFYRFQYVLDRILNDKKMSYGDHKR